jgi:hypothetical protein
MTMQSAQRDEVGAPTACGGEHRKNLQRMTLTPPSTGITAPVM